MSATPPSDLHRLASLQDLALWGPGALLLFTSAKVVSVAHGSTSTALAIVQHAGTANVIIGVSVDILPIIFLAIAAIPLASVPSGSGFRAVPTPSRVFFGLMLLMLPLAFLLIVAVGTLVGLALLLLAERLLHRKWKPGITWIPWAVILALALVDNCWLPAERVVTASGTKSAYVLSADRDRVVLLSTGRREISILSGDEVKARSICTINRPISGLLRVRALSVLWSLGKQPEYRECPGD